MLNRTTIFYVLQHAYAILNIINPLRIALMNTNDTTGLNKKSHPQGWPQTFCSDFAPLLDYIKLSI